MNLKWYLSVIYTNADKNDVFNDDDNDVNDDDATLMLQTNDIYVVKSSQTR